MKAYIVGFIAGVLATLVMSEIVSVISRVAEQDREINKIELFLSHSGGQ